MPFELPKALKIAQLKLLAVACGVPSSGTKEVMFNRIESALQAVPARNAIPAKDRRILSIDMGIRNLAFALLTPSGTYRQTNHDFRSPFPVHLHEWKHAVLAPSIPESDQWSPLNMAQLAVPLVRQQLLTMEPTHILIERQRYRTGGAASVQEWTLRVNALEAMIHAALRTMQELKQWTGEVHSVGPSRVGPFFLDGTEAFEDEDLDVVAKEPKVVSGRANKLALKLDPKLSQKKAKIDLVGRWLEHPKIIAVEGGAMAVAPYLSKWTGASNKAKAVSKQPGSETLRKLDDLADSLLQGMAWIKWEDNKRLLAKKGPAAILQSVSHNASIHLRAQHKP